MTSQTSDTHIYSLPMSSLKQKLDGPANKDTIRYSLTGFGSMGEGGGWKVFRDGEIKHLRQIRHIYFGLLVNRSVRICPRVE